MNGKVTMFDTLRDFFATIGRGEASEQPGGLDEVRVASAALLYHVVDSDGVVTKEEAARLHEVLRTEFTLSDEEVEAVATAGKDANSEAVDLFRFTSVLKARLEVEERIRFVELLWEVTYADGSVHELEDNLIWRVSDLLGVSTRERMLAKREAAKRSQTN